MHLSDDDSDGLRHAAFEHYQALFSATRWAIQDLEDVLRATFNPGVELDLGVLHEEYMARRQQVFDAFQSDLAAEDAVLTALLHQWLVPLSEGRPADEEAVLRILASPASAIADEDLPDFGEPEPEPEPEPELVRVASPLPWKRYAQAPAPAAKPAERKPARKRSPPKRHTPAASSARVEEGDWMEALQVIEETLALLDDLPEQAEDFRESVQDKLENICDWVREREFVTDAQANAINNMARGVDKWLQR